jgi:hypothetical protein
MLVNMGDLPQPEQDVLSQTVWSPLERANSGASTGSLPIIPAVSDSAGSMGGSYTTITTVPGTAVGAVPLKTSTAGDGQGSANGSTNGSSNHKRPESVDEAMEDAHSSKRAKF